MGFAVWVTGRSSIQPVHAIVKNQPELIIRTSIGKECSPSLSPSEHRTWYVAYTCAHHERRVAEQFKRKEIEHLLPLYESCRRWKDRQIYLQFPLFPSYIFVRMALTDRMSVLQTAGVVRLVGFGGNPTPINEEEIVSLRRALVDARRVQPHPYVTVGQRVRVTAGPLVGYEGILIRRKTKLRVVLSINVIERSIAVDMDASCIEPAPTPGPSHRRASV